eukprot:TRINITY_DN3904_c0_g1_i3.p1 TRINITY_DN3904_c0_g1~~TRINITY_DN3904_c0_g1_i3.p1  ORF type:complete len:567 (+),score=140.98 TRINITY_DN3904_c0_g1_i3:69-1769(+)
MLSLARSFRGLGRTSTNLSQTFNLRAPNTRRFLCQSPFDTPRAQDDLDVVIVGGGPSGLAAAIKLKKLAQAEGKDLRVCVVEKAAELGRHTLSGACIEPRALTELIPDWKEKGAPLNIKATEDQFLFLTQKYSIPLPVPGTLHNEGNYVVSLSNFVRWLGTQAEELGVEVYTGIAASEVLQDESGSVIGIATNDVGIGKDGKPTENFQRGMELRARLTLFAEGCRGHLTKRLIKKFNLREGSDPQTYGIGIKELWEVDPKKHQPGKIVHTVGWPVPSDVYGGSFLYHFENNQVAVGFVVALDYKNPYLNPYQEFQKYKTHPAIRSLFEGGNCIGYGARAISEGGLQSIPKLIFPGGALIGDTAGFLNVPKIKGTHTAMKSGILAAEAAWDSLKAETDKPILLENYPQKFRSSWLYEELHEVRNIRPYFHYGLYAGMALSGLDHYILRGKAPWTLHTQHEDHESYIPASQAKKPDYPKPDGKLTFDLLTNLSRSFTNHNEDQPAHLTLKDPTVPTRVNLPLYDGPESRFCPAGVYEYVADEKGGQKTTNQRLQLHSLQNMRHQRPQY